MSTYARKAVCAIVGTIAMTWIASSLATAAVTEERDSTHASFWQYEFNVSPDIQDLDGNMVNDFVVGGDGTFSFDGIYHTDSLTAGSANCMSATDNLIWDQSGITWETGYTLEVRARVNSVAEDATLGASYLHAVAQSATGASSLLNLYDDKVTWGNSASVGPLLQASNSDDFHVFRIAQEPGANSFSVWRDGLLIGSELGATYYNPSLNRLILGDAGGVHGGNVDYDYLRFSPGAYAPVDQILPGAPTTEKSSSEFVYKYEMDVDPTDPGAIDLDTNSLADWSVGGNGITELTGNGTILFDTESKVPGTEEDGNSAYIESGLSSTDHIWPRLALNSIDGFTVEISVKVLSDSGEQGAMALFARPADTTEGPGLSIAANGQFWYSGIGLENEGVTYDNTDGFHQFRIVRNSELLGGEWYVWRDDELLTPDGIDAGYFLSGAKAIYLGDAGGTVQEGIAEVEYVRFMEGAFAPVTEEPLPGDANKDGKVDGSDVTILAGNWQAGVGAPDPSTVTWEMGDFNGDGQVDGSDVTILAGNWQAGVTAATASVPEPSTLLLLVGMTAGLTLLRRK